MKWTYTCVCLAFIIKSSNIVGVGLERLFETLHEKKKTLFIM